MFANKTSGFGKCTLLHHRVIGINDHNFFITREINLSRINIRYYSEEFQNILKDSNIGCYKEINLPFEKRAEKYYKIEEKYEKHLDTLPDVTWKINGYY
jgi:hypothetical protein